ncbi:hypothetical protein COU80_06180 [Candidatus Peregrinibacteria bacterium CG10_big_fil_rev_8_21_14_0_10_55_24]|nr:MAG: hypothetical protein COU80_06180 [Candidatus Peregrinibacteria bacterium CG10_big_fil_rev_8_21_14_0_10_55_24]
MPEREKTESRELIPGSGTRIAYPTGISEVRSLLTAVLEDDRRGHGDEAVPTEVRDDELPPEQKQMLLTALEKRLSRPNACRAKGVTYAKVEAILNRNPRLLRSLYYAEQMGGYMEVTSLNNTTIVFDDVAQELDVAAQIHALDTLGGTPVRETAVKALELDIYAIRSYLHVPSEDEDPRGLNYYEFLVLCTAYGLEPMSQDVYDSLQNQTPLDRKTTCWLKTEKPLLDKNLARHGFRNTWIEGRGSSVFGTRPAVDRHFDIRGGRFRIQGNIA